MESCKWLHFYAFFNWVLKLCAWTDAKSHFLHFCAFLQSEFECPQFACLCRCKVALMAFVRFFSRVSLNVLKLPACTDAKSHWLHLYAFSPKGVFRCFLKSPAWIDGKSQMVALVRFFQLSPQIVCPKRCKVALVAFLHFFTWGSFQMFSQIACLNRWKNALITFERLFT